MANMVPWVTETYPHRSTNVSPCRTINLYTEIVKQPESKAQSILIGTPGTTEAWDLSAIATGTVRGMYYALNGRMFVVVGGDVIELPNPNGSSEISEPTLRLEVANSAATVSIVDNGRYLVIADSQTLQLFNMDTNEAVAPDVFEIENPIMVAFLNDRVICINNTSQFFWSELGLDGVLEWDALSFSTPLSPADKIISMAKRQGDLWFFSENGFSVWRIDTNPDQPFSKVGGSSNQIGCGAAYSVAEIADQVFWLGSSTAGKDQVFMSNGYGAQRISNHAIEHLITSSAEYSTSTVSFTYQQEGHTFYVLNLIDANKTLVYDLATGQWHERATRDPSTNTLNRWTSLYSVYAFGKVYVGNSTAPSILELDLDKYDEYDGRAIVRIHEGPVLWKNMTRAVHQEFRVDMETGTGLQTGQGSVSPKAMLQYSDDSGHTWSSELWTSIGAIGEYATTVAWRRLGAASNRVYRLTISDPIKVVIIAGRAVISRATKR